MQKQFTLWEIPGYEDLAYLDWIRGLPCCVCLDPEAEPHHVGPHGVGQKCADYLTIPLCRDCHEKVHRNGDIFFQVNIVDWKDVVINCQANYQGRQGK